MAPGAIPCHDHRGEIRSPAFWGEFLDTWANRKVLFGVLRALRSPETGKPLVTYQELAESVGYPDRRNGQNFLQECEACAEDFTGSLRRKRQVDAAVVAAVTVEVRQAPLALASALCQRVAGRLPRAELSPANIHAALEPISCTVIREPLRRAGETGGGPRKKTSSCNTRWRCCHTPHGRESDRWPSG